MRKIVSIINVKAILLAAFVLTSFITPVWQSAVSSNLQKEIALQKNSIAVTAEKKMAYNSSIARKTTPEYLYEMALDQNISFSLVESSTTKVATR